MTNPEDRLRQAIAARTNAVETSPDSLEQIQEKLMDAHRTERNRSRLLIGLGAAAAVVAIVLAAVLVTQDDDDSNVDVADQTSTTADGAPSSTSSTTATTVTPVEADPSQTIYPTAATGVVYDDPNEAAADFVTDIIGMDNPVLSDFEAGDNRSGEVAVYRRAGQAKTTLFLRLLEDDNWYVIGAITENITLTRPSPGGCCGLSSPIRLEGESIAFEAQVNVLVFADAKERTVVGESFVMGGGSEVAPFEGEVAYDLAGLDVERGTLVLLTYSAEDGSVVEFTAMRIPFG